jgi:hypothetical protein
MRSKRWKSWCDLISQKELIEDRKEDTGLGSTSLYAFMRFGEAIVDE